MVGVTLGRNDGASWHPLLINLLPRYRHYCYFKRHSTLLLILKKDTVHYDYYLFKGHLVATVKDTNNFLPCMLEKGQRVHEKKHNDGPIFSIKTE